MRAKCYDDYCQERQALTSKDVDRLLESGRRWDLASVLINHGVIVFPHTFLHACGSHTASCVHAALDSGADQILVLGVLHASTDKQKKYRAKEKAFEDVSKASLRNIYGPELTHAEELDYEYSLQNFLFLFDEEVKRRGCKRPTLYIRYPFLANRSPETLPGITELEVLAKDSVVVATADFSHHGVAYGVPKQEALAVGVKAKRVATQNVTEHIELLQHASYDDYYRHCLKISSDAFDVGMVIRHLIKPKRSTLLDLAIVDTSMLYDNNPSPSWVAASLITLESVA